MTSIKINIINLLRTTEIEDFSNNLIETLNEGIIEAFGDFDNGFKIMTVPYIPQIEYQVDLETFVSETPNAERLREFLAECCFNVQSVVMHSDGLLLNIYRK